MTGQTVSHYRILEKIGQGGMGEVYLAEDTKLKRQVALKFLPRQMTADADARERFEREAQAAAALNHPNIVTVYEIGEHEGQVFIAMEYVEGRTLKELISPDRPPSTINRLPVSLVLDIATQLASGLTTAHTKGIVHRDIKPQNILVDKNHHVKILDFGLAKLKGVSQLTMESSTLGTVHYMSPEQAMGREVDHRTDIWSLGVVLYEMLTGQIPFKGDYEQAVIYSILNEEPEPVTGLRCGVPVGLDRILLKALAKDREERFQHADDLLAELRCERKSQESMKAGRAIPEKVPAKSKRKTMTLVLAAVGAVPIIVALGIFGPKLFRSKTPTQEFRKNSIAVMYFEDRSGEENFGKILSEMLISNLSRCKEIDVVSSQHLFDILKKMKIEDSGTISRSMATDVARNAGVGAMLLGSIDRIGNTFSVNAQLCSVSTGSVIGPAQARGPRVEDVYEMVNRLTEEVIRLMGVSLPGDGQALRINDITTHSFEAYKHYQKGQEQLQRFNFRAASREFESAIRIDRAFVMAHVYLAFSRDIFKVRDPFSDLSQARQAMRQAKQYAAGVSGDEQEFIRVADALFQRDFVAMIAVLETAVKTNPDNHMFSWWLGFAYATVGNRESAIRTLQKLIVADPENVNALLTLAYTYSRQNKHSQAVSTIRNYVALLPDVLNSYDSACDIYLKAGMYDEAFRVCEEALKAKPEWSHPLFRQSYIHLIRGEGALAREKNMRLQAIRPELKRGWTDDLGCFNLHEGRLLQAEAEFKTAIQLTRDKKDIAGEIEERLVLGRYYGGRKDFAKAGAQFSLIKKLSKETHEGIYNTWPVRIDYYWGVASLEDGRINECRAAAERIREYIENNNCDHVLMIFYHLLLAEMELKDGRAAIAADTFGKIPPFFRNYAPRCRLFAADMMAMQGKIDLAKQAYDDLRDDWEGTFSGQSGDFFDFWQIRSTMNYRIAKMYDKAGDKKQAIEYYLMVLDQWKNADKDMAEYVDAKARLAHLKMGK